jgi:hypothetical protein
MDPASGTGVVVIGACVVIVGVGLYFLLKHYCRLVVSAAPPVHVALYGSVSFTATLQRKSWAFGTWTTVVPATYTATGGSTAASAVSGSPTAAAAPSATVTVTGAANGTDTVKVSASGGDCTGVTGDVAIAVP